MLKSNSSSACRWPACTSPRAREGGPSRLLEVGLLALAGTRVHHHQVVLRAIEGRLQRRAVVLGDAAVHLLQARVVGDDVLRHAVHQLAHPLDRDLGVAVVLDVELDALEARLGEVDEHLLVERRRQRLDQRVELVEGAGVGELLRLLRQVGVGRVRLRHLLGLERDHRVADLLHHPQRHGEVVDRGHGAGAGELLLLRDLDRGERALAEVELHEVGLAVELAALQERLVGRGGGGLGDVELGHRAGVVARDLGGPGIEEGDRDGVDLRLDLRRLRLDRLVRVDALLQAADRSR
jgi:hypothetical protein